MPLPKPKLLAGWRRAKLIALINELYYTSAFAVVAPVGLWSTRLRCPQIHRLDLFVTRWPSTCNAQRNQNSEPKLRPLAVSKSLTRSNSAPTLRACVALFPLLRPAEFRVFWSGVPAGARVSMIVPAASASERLV